MAQTIMDSPIGALFIDTSEKGVRLMSFLGGVKHDALVADLPEQPMHSRGPADELLNETQRQLNQYFDGKRRHFDLPLDVKGSPFRRRVWEVIASIPFGQTATYAEVAAMAGAPNAYRAAGSACSANPTAVIVPCHRVVGSDRSLHGFGGGLDTKLWLLRHEGSLDSIRPTYATKALAQPALI
jgi:methylated-DNA-[protein]-cysteine S-methyltransferase